MLQLAQADGAEVRRPPQGLVQAERPLHDAAQPAAAAQAQQAAELVARDLREQATSVLGLDPAHPAQPQDSRAVPPGPRTLGTEARPREESQG